MDEKKINTADRKKIAVYPKTPPPLRHPPAVIHQLILFLRKLPALLIALSSLIILYFKALASKMRKR